MSVLVEPLNLLMLVAVPVALWMLIRRKALGFALAIVVAFALNVIVNQATFRTMSEHDKVQFNQMYWLAFGCRFVALVLSIIGIWQSLIKKRVPAKTGAKDS